MVTWLECWRTRGCGEDWPQTLQEVREILMDDGAVEELEAEVLGDRLDTLCERLNLGLLASD